MAGSQQLPSIIYFCQASESWNHVNILKIFQTDVVAKFDFKMLERFSLTDLFCNDHMSIKAWIFFLSLLIFFYLQLPKRTSAITFKGYIHCILLVFLSGWRIALVKKRKLSFISFWKPFSFSTFYWSKHSLVMKFGQFI